MLEELDIYKSKAAYLQRKTVSIVTSVEY